MSQSSFHHQHQIDPPIERLIRISLRAMGIMALAICLLFWLSLLLR